MGVPRNAPRRWRTRSAPAPPMPQPDAHLPASSRCSPCGPPPPPGRRGSPQRPAPPGRRTSGGSECRSYARTVQRHEATRLCRAVAAKPRRFLNHSINPLPPRTPPAQNTSSRCTPGTAAQTAPPPPLRRLATPPHPRTPAAPHRQTGTLHLPRRVLYLNLHPVRRQSRRHQPLGPRRVRVEVQPLGDGDGDAVSRARRWAAPRRRRSPRDPAQQRRPRHRRSRRGPQRRQRLRRRHPFQPHHPVHRVRHPRPGPLQRRRQTPAPPPPPAPRTAPPRSPRKGPSGCATSRSSPKAPRRHTSTRPHEQIRLIRQRVVVRPPINRKA